MDYALPRADDLPDFDITLTGVPTDANPLGVKGSGQAGASPRRRRSSPRSSTRWRRSASTHIDMPATPERVWRAIRSAAHG